MIEVELNMKKKALISFIILFCVVLMPIKVDAAKTTKQCSYYVNENQLSNSGGGTINCEFNWSDKILFFGGFSYSCKYDMGKNGEMTVLIRNYTYERGTGFALDDWFEKNKSCPKYMVFNHQNLNSRDSTYAANTDKQVELIRKKYGQDYTPYLETSIRDEEIKDDPDSDSAKACESKKKSLDDAMALLEFNRNKLIEMNCQNYKLTDEERDTVASPENIKWGRECQQITDSYSITVNSARSALNDYVKSGCLDENSDEYKEYESKIDSLYQEVKEIDDNIEEQNGVPTDDEEEWEQLGEDISSDDFNNVPECDDIINMEEGHVGWMLNTILNYIKILGPVLVVLLSAIDFIKAVVGTDEKAMKEAQSKLVIRLVAALCLFLVPTLVQLLLSFINATTCSIG